MPEGVNRGWSERVSARAVPICVGDASACAETTEIRGFGWRRRQGRQDFAGPGQDFAAGDRGEWGL